MAAIRLVRVGDLLGVARLQRRQRRQELALVVHEAEHVDHVAERQLFVEAAAPTHEHISGGHDAAKLRITSQPSCRKRNRRLSRRTKERAGEEMPS